MYNPEALWRWARQWRHENLNVDRVGVLTHVDEAGALGPRYAFMTLMSCGIAMLGLLQNSAAVIIGAMLISPLMGPIVELGMSLATFDFRSLRDSLKTLVVGIALSLLIAIVIVSVSPLQDPTPEILARTQPTLFDLLVAIFSGLAGAYATVTRKGETIVGVAIATALMPPLAVTGFGIAVGNASIAGGAAFLFMTNLLAIGLSVTIMARWYGFGRGDSPKQTVWQAMLIVGTFLLLSIPLGVALGNIAARGLADRSVRSTLDAAAREGNGRITTLRVDRNDKTLLVDAVLLTPTRRPKLAQQLERSLETQLGQPVVVELREVLTADDAELAQDHASLAQLRESVNRLQTVAERDAQARTQDDQAVQELRQRALAHFGQLEVLQGGEQARWRLAADAGLDIAAARALENSLDGQPGVPRTEVLPALQSLPIIEFGDDSAALDQTAINSLQDMAWALSRWQSRAVSVEGFAGGDPGLAQARADAVAGWLREHGTVVKDVSAADADAARELVAEHGRRAIRAATVTSLIR